MMLPPRASGRSTPGLVSLPSAEALSIARDSLSFVTPLLWPPPFSPLPWAMGKRAHQSADGSGGVAGDADEMPRERKEETSCFWWPVTRELECILIRFCSRVCSGHG